MLERLILWLLKILQGRIEKKIERGQVTAAKAKAWDGHIADMQRKNDELRRQLHAD